MDADGFCYQWVLLINIAMHYFARVLPLLQRFLDFFSEHHRAVFTAGTSERHRQIALALFNVVRHQECQQSFHTSQKFSGLRKGTDESTHFSRTSREFSQARNEMRIRQESYVEDQVRIDRHAIFIAETHHRNEHRMAVGIFESACNEASQLMHIELR